MQDFVLFLQNHWQLSAAFGVVLFLLIILEFIKQNSGNQLSPAKATQLINHENAVIVDIRNTDAFTTGHIVGAISLPQKDLNDKIKKIEKNKSQPIILVCATGIDSPKVVKTLQDKGFTVYVLAGGMRAWKDNSMPIVKS